MAWEDLMITVEELVAIDALKLTYFGGETGGHRYVSWAHVCDLADPWNWVNPGDLVMTTGAGLPSPGSTETLGRTSCAGSRQRRCSGPGT